ncbi:MAG: VCBS repeat-containing protein, partial [Planctomycetes bacterium]|nr:VCBS repeat-containing protein [Planctomycetota bacterium]
LDLDGRGDVATIDVQRAVHVYLQTAPSTLVDATGTWVEPHVDREQASIFPGLYVSIARLLAHDFDADGDPDLVIGGAEARYSSFTVGVPPKLLVNDGGRRLVDGSRTRGFDPRTHRSTGGIAVGDVDGDGDVDAVLSDWWAYGVPSLYHNDGFGNFVLDPASFATRAFSLALVDLDGDGDLDLVEGQGIYFTGTGVAAASGQDRVRLNDGLGNFTDVTAANMPAFVGLTSDLAIGDVDGDGDQDIVTTCAGREAQTLRVLINDGNAGFTLGFAALPAKEAWSVELADFDGDGDLDIAVTETGSMYYFTNDGAGGFVDETAARVPSPSSYGGFTVALTSADVDGDGDLDLNHPFATLLNDGSGVFSFSPPALPCMPFYGKVHFADFDEDGELESASGSSGLCVAGALPSYNGGVNVVFDAIAPADVDGDGDVDLLVPSRVNEIGTHVHDHASRLGLLFNLRRQLRAPLLPRLGRDFPVVMYGTDGSGTSHGIAFFGYATTRTVIPGIGSLVLDPASAVPVSGVLAVAGSDGATVPVAIPTAPVLQGMAFAAQAAVWHGGDLGTVRLTNAVRGEIIR